MVFACWVRSTPPPPAGRGRCVDSTPFASLFQANFQKWDPELGRWGPEKREPRTSRRTDISVFYCFHKNNDGSKCEVVHTRQPGPGPSLLVPVLHAWGDIAMQS